MSEIGIIFPHQLFANHEIYQKSIPLYLIEEHLFFKQFKFHKLKLAYHRATMKSFEFHLKEHGNDVHYINHYEESADIRCFIEKKVSKASLQKIHFTNPTDNWLELRLQQSFKKFELESEELENPLFLNKRGDLKSFFKKSKKSFFQTTFYKQQRKKRNILLKDDGDPKGGQWTFDKENRKKYPKDKTPPVIPQLKQNKFWDEAIEYVDKHFDSNPGELPKNPPYPIDHNESKTWLNQFLNERFEEFGDYEDAIVKKEHFLNHSVLTPMLNIGLIDPKTLLDEVMAYENNHHTRINSVEGFVRQITGWREFIRGMYEVKGSYSRIKNFWGFHKKIPSSFYDGTTGITPLDDTIKKILKTGYCHHIERLMIVGNFMLLCEFAPDEVYRWFMELFIDAYDWVMVPNVYGMSQFADGGLFATKPYISSSNYLMKMSDYSKGEWQEKWDALFWRFMNKNRDFFQSNPRLGMLIKTYDRMSQEKKEHMEKIAEQFIAQLD